jgi:hypothetical protein
MQGLKQFTRRRFYVRDSIMASIPTTQPENLNSPHFSRLTPKRFLDLHQVRFILYIILFLFMATTKCGKKLNFYLFFVKILLNWGKIVQLVNKDAIAKERARL